jgi:hypothetical protein
MYATASGIRLSWGQITKAKMTGIVKKGLPDICLPVAKGKYHGLYIELKTETGRPSNEQKFFIKRLQEEGYLATISYGYISTIELIERYFNNE